MPLSGVTVTSTPVKSNGSQQNTQTEHRVSSNDFDCLVPNCVICHQKQKTYFCENCGQKWIPYLIQEHLGASDDSGNSTGSGSSGRSSTICSDTQIQASNVCGATDWHNFITSNLRLSIVLKLVEAIFPTPGLDDMCDERMHNLVAYATKIESDAYDVAKSMCQYYRLLAEEIFENQKKLEKRQQNREEQQMHAAQMAQNRGGTTLKTSQPSQPLNQNQIHVINVGAQERPSVVNQNQMEQQDGSKSATTRNSKSAELDDCDIATKKLCNQVELVAALLPTWDKMCEDEDKTELKPFLKPVDPVAFPDYLDVVKRPMDLSTIKTNLTTGQYSDPWEYIGDVWLMFDNAWQYNHRNSRVYFWCTQLSEIFKSAIDSAMHSLGYCCGQKYTFSPQTLFCDKSQCIIPFNATYYSHTSIKENMTNEFILCRNCFNKNWGDSDTFKLNDSRMESRQIRKTEFIEMKNDNSKLQPLVECQECGRKQHKICVFYHDKIWPNGFVCGKCLPKKDYPPKINQYKAEHLPQTKLGEHIETRVNGFLRIKQTNAAKIHIRVLSSSNKTVIGHVDKFPYRHKAIFAFQETDGIDLCFFGMYVQEYGSECSPPNARRVYIAYLDSVNFFEPKKYRTAVYYEIVLGYLDYAKRLGYTMAHIWASPPPKGKDYIFNCHPPDQKIPKPEMLQDWYKKMLKQGENDGIVLKFNNIMQHVQEEKLTSATDLPYFEDDHLPKLIEQIELKQQEEAKKPNTSKTNHTNSKSWSDRFCKKLKSWKDAFFVVRLHAADSIARLTPIQDPDTLNQFDLIDSRESFSSFLQENFHQFSSKRHAQYSTFCILYELHNKDVLKYHCDNCGRYVEARYHCTVCDGFYLCRICKDDVEHEHAMKELSSDFENQKQSIPHMIARLQHACVCNDDQCRQPKCVELKKIIDHASKCKQCVKCKQFIALCCCHAKQCNEVNCPMPNCQRIKNQIIQQ